ncbi:hypothetical protein CJ010_03645 [Azoarcus sp. DD4]|uniref:hypothetical protein n=1 Tax=Azoarcus sp. DD4 TaxID=2027405 RepID=UPI0011287F6B|nr:hypothetical protein [Azoarcus sp. DD4]QDF95708.1 hypothetical protein CJ010_03645 [Azoarcus sp. DD4]
MGVIALILFHKQSTSGRLRFARFDNTVVAARIDVDGDPEVVTPHPGILINQAAARLGLAVGELRVEPEFRERMLAPGGTASVWIAEFAAIDPPFAAVEQAGGRFVLLTELQGIPDTERDVMRSVYEHVLGG